jgi:hypothetical protein
VFRFDDCEGVCFVPRRADAATNDFIRDRLRNGHLVTDRRKLANIVATVCVGVHIAVFFKWPPGTDMWWLASEISALLAVGGSLYAGVKASRWWLVITGIEVAWAIMLIVALAG